jgi:hypothetical protein
MDPAEARTLADLPAVFDYYSHKARRLRKAFWRLVRRHDRLAARMTCRASWARIRRGETWTAKDWDRAREDLARLWKEKEAAHDAWAAASDADARKIDRAVARIEAKYGPM